jgi:hypothetical protein
MGGRIAALLIGKLGRRAFTTISNICCALSFGLWSFPQQSTMWYGIIMMLPSINAVNASGIKSMATDLAVAQGMGKGEFYTCYTSLRAFTVFIAPLLYSKVYNVSKSVSAMPTGSVW